MVCGVCPPLKKEDWPTDSSSPARVKGSKANSHLRVSAVARTGCPDAVKRRAVRKHARGRRRSRQGTRQGRTRAARPVRRAKAGPRPAPVEIRDGGTGHHPQSFRPQIRCHAAPPPPRQVSPRGALGRIARCLRNRSLFLTARISLALRLLGSSTGNRWLTTRSGGRMAVCLLRVFEKNHADPFESLTLGHDSRNCILLSTRLRPPTVPSWFLAARRPFPRDQPIRPRSPRRHLCMQFRPIPTARFARSRFDISVHPRTFRDHSRPMPEGEALADALHRLQLAGFRFPFKLGLGTWPMDYGPSRRTGARSRRRSIPSDQMDRSRLLMAASRLQENSAPDVSAFSPSVKLVGTPAEGVLVRRERRVIIYGATETDGKSHDHGKREVRSDGPSLSVRLPDGQYKCLLGNLRPQVTTRARQLTFERQSPRKAKWVRSTPAQPQVARAA